MVPPHFVYVETGEFASSPETDTVHALDARSGTEKWSYATAGRIGSSPTVVNGIIYIDVNDHSASSLSARDARSGTTLWSISQGGNFAPTVVNGIIYVALDATLYAIQPRPNFLALRASPL